MEPLALHSAQARRSNSDLMIPDHITHYFRDRPFRTLTELSHEECARVVHELGLHEKLPRRLQSDFYFEQRRRFEGLMHEQFVHKGGRPQRRVPHYAILGESEIWARIRPSAIRIPLDGLPSDVISFTYTDSFANYVDRDLSGNPIPRKTQYGTVYRREELSELFEQFGWPGDRWKTESNWAHDVYVEVQIWDDEPLRPFFPATGAG